MTSAGSELSKIASQSRALWNGLSPARRALLVLASAAALAGVAWGALRSPDDPYSILFSGLAPEDAGAVVEHLTSLKAPYRIVQEGTAIAVPEGKVHELRIQMASAGLPRGGGVGFELFDKQGFGASTFTEQLNYRRALSGELSRSIASLDAVERARVHLAIPERSLYARQDEAPSASVVVRLRPGRALAPQQVRGVVHLVASSVPRLVAPRVTVVDEGGTVLWSGDEAIETSEAQRDLERTLARRVTEITERIVGAGHSVVVVTAELDSAHTERTEERFGKDGALRSESRNEERGGGLNGGGGLAGVRGNLPSASASRTGTAAGNAERMHVSETRNFEVDRVVSRTTGPRMQIRRLHVAVVVDGVPEVETATAGKGQGPTRQRARSNEELEHIAALAREAAGLDPARGDRIEVRSVPALEGAFVAEPTRDTPPQWTWQSGLQWPVAASAVVVALAFGALLWRARRRGRRAKAASGLPSLPLRVADAETALVTTQAQKPATPILTPREVAQLSARENAARAAEVLTVWLAEAKPLSSSPQEERR